MSWLISKALMNSLCSQELEAASLGENFSDGEQSALSNGSNTPQAYCAPDKMTGFSRLSRFGMTYKPLMENLGEELLTLYLAAFHAKTSPQRGGGAGIDGERSGMWREMARIIHEVRPGYVFVENSPMLTSRGLGRVLGDLASMGFDARWGVLGAADVGANHQRDRIWIVGKATNANSNRLQKPTDQQKLESQGRNQLQIEQPRNSSQMAYTSQIRSFSEEAKQGMAREFRFAECGMDSNWWKREPSNVPRISQRNMGGVADGLASRVDRLKAIGNGQVPLCAATAWRILNDF
jgi:DNA (cytosine-5)-methyltransferase 1